MNKISIRNNEQLDNNVVEAFDMLRTNIEFAGDKAKVIVITSACTKEGKSFIAFELANNMAENGKRVLLVMADFRKGVKGKTNDVEGMSEVLRGVKGLNDTVYKTDVKNMYMMFSGENVDEIQTVLDSAIFSKMIEVLKKKFDYVLFDTAPVLDSNITSLICSKSDGAIICIEQEKTRYDVVFQAKEQIELTGCNVLGVVLNNPS